MADPNLNVGTPSGLGKEWTDPTYNPGPQSPQAQGKTEPAKTSTDPKASDPGAASYSAGGLSKLMGDVQKPALPQPGPSFEQQVESFMAPYVNELTSLGPEYGKEMEFLAPYLSPETNFSGVTAAANAESGGGVQAFNPNAPGQAAMTDAEAALGSAVAGQQPGFSREDQPIQSYVQSIPAQAPIQAQLAYQKYLETYGSEPVNTSLGLSPQQQSAINAISGGQTASGGLPSIAQTGAASTAAKLLNPSTSTSPAAS